MGRCVWWVCGLCVGVGGGWMDRGIDVPNQPTPTHLSPDWPTNRSTIHIHVWRTYTQEGRRGLVEARALLPTLCRLSGDTHKVVCVYVCVCTWVCGDVSGWVG